VVLGDGARWIWTLAAEHFGERRELVDFYHASEHLWTVARLLHGEGTPAAAAWAQARCHELRHEGLAPVLTALKAARATTAEGRLVLRRGGPLLPPPPARLGEPPATAARPPRRSRGPHAAP